MFYDKDEPSTLAQPYSGRRYNLDLINRLMDPSIRSVRGMNEISLEPGQLVWKFDYRGSINSYTLDYDARGPFVIIAKSWDRYVLVDQVGFLHPVSVPAHQLVPAVTTWHAMRLPESLVNDKEVEKLLLSLRTEYEGL